MGYRNKDKDLKALADKSALFRGVATQVWFYTASRKDISLVPVRPAPLRRVDPHTSGLFF